MPQITSSEVREFCLKNLWKYFKGEITRDELDQKVSEIEKQIAPEEIAVPSLFEVNDLPKGR